MIQWEGLLGPLKEKISFCGHPHSYKPVTSTTKKKIYSVSVLWDWFDLDDLRGTSQRAGLLVFSTGFHMIVSKKSKDWVHWPSLLFIFFFICLAMCIVLFTFEVVTCLWSGNKPWSLSHGDPRPLMMSSIDAWKHYPHSQLEIMRFWMNPDLTLILM
jgi:hypothetical protein